jgi:antitoxin ParD1/3/4
LHYGFGAENLDFGRRWTTKHAWILAKQKVRIDGHYGLADVAAGRVKDFDAAGIIERGRKLSAAPSSSV